MLRQQPRSGLQAAEKDAPWSESDRLRVSSWLNSIKDVGMPSWMLHKIPSRIANPCVRISLETLKCQTGGADQWVLKRRECSGLTG